MMQFESESLLDRHVDQTIDFTVIRAEMRRLADQGLYLDNYEYVKSQLGDDLLQWPGCEGGLLALRIADCLGGTQLANVLTYRLGRLYPDNLEVRFLRTMQKLSRQPLARVWLQIRDQQLETDDPELQSQWAVVKGLILCGMRDFDRGFELLEQGHSLLPDDPRPVLRIATAHLSNDRLDLAIQTCRDAVAMIPSYPPSIQTLSHLLLQDNQVDEAFEVLRDSIGTTQSGGCRLQLASMEIQRRQYAAAKELIGDLEDYFPLADPARNGRAKQDSVRSSLAKMRSELACYDGDYETAIALAHEANNKFHDTLVENLKNNREGGKRKRLDVPFVRQNDVTCAPATLAMLSAYWGIEVDHDAVVNEICYDGTAPVRQRAWAEANGMVVREFRLTEQVAHQLIDAEIPFGISSVDPGGGHINVVCGYDSRRGVLLMQDPGTWHGIEALLREFIEQYQAFGPRGLVLIPQGKQSLLEGIEMPDVDRYDQQHAIAIALQKHDRDDAVAILDSMRSSDPDNLITLWSEVELARYDFNLPQRLNVIQKLRENFPDTELLTLAECDLLAMIDRQDKVIERLRECVRGETPSIESRLRLLTRLESESDSEEKHEQLRRILKDAPTNPEGLSQEAILLWDRMQRDDALELLRLASMTGERDEDHARRYLAAAARMNRQDEAIEVMRVRFEKHGHASGQPGMTYAYALARTTHADRAAEVIRKALQVRPEDGDLLCEAASALGRFEKPSVGLELLENATIPLPKDQVLYAKANLALSAGQPDEALEALLDLHHLQPMNFDAVSRIADLKATVGGIGGAIEFLERITCRHPHCRGLLSITAEYMHRAARYEDAVGYLDRILETCDFDAWAWRERSLVCSAAGWYDEAYRSAVRGLECERSAMSYNILAEAESGQGDVESAVNHCRQAVQLDCDYPPAMLTWVKLCKNEDENKETLDEIFQQLVFQHSNGDGVIAYKRFSTGFVDDAKLCSQYQQLREVRPDVLTMHTIAADHHCDCKRFTEAEEVLRSVEERFSYLPEYWQHLGEVYLAKNDMPAAVEAFEKALELDPFNRDLAIRTAQVYQTVERPQDAEKTLRRALGAAPADAALMVELGKHTEDESERGKLIFDAAMLSPNNSDTWAMLLSLCQFENREADAVQAARDLVAQRPSDSNATLRLAEMLHREDQWDESVGVIKSAIERDPRNVDLHGLLAQRYYERGMIDDAIASCSPEGIDPFDLNQLNLFAANLLNLTGKTEEACERVVSALERDPSNLEGWSRLADWAETLEKFELYDLASTALLDRAPYLASSHGYYSSTALRRGNREEAKEHLQRALDLDGGYVYAVPELLGLFIEDSEIDRAERFVGSLKDRVDEMALSIAQGTLAIAQGNDAGLITVFQKFPSDADYVTITREILRHFELSSDGELAKSLNKAVRQKNASASLGYLWSRINVQEDNLAEGVKRFLKLPEKSEVLSAAAFDVIRKVSVWCESDDMAIRKSGNRLAIRIVRKLGTLTYGSGMLWKAATWMLLYGEENKRAAKLASKYQLVVDREAHMMVPAVLAALCQRDLRLASELVQDAISYRADSMNSEMMVIIAMYGVHAMDLDRLDEAIRLVDKNDLDWAFKRMAQLITIGVDCIREGRGDEERLIDHWMDEFAHRELQQVDQYVFAELRGRIAEAAGQRRLAKKLRKAKYVMPRNEAPPAN